MSKELSRSRWQDILRTNIRSIDELRSLFQLDEDFIKNLFSESSFPINIPQRLAKKIERDRPFDDPIFRQFVPLLEEAKKVSGFHMEPVADSCFQKSERLLQKYESRALIVTTGACAMNCRFCFRQNYPYEEFALLEQSPFEKEVEYVRRDPSLHEIILSGGDPLSLSNRALQTLFNDLNSIPHLQRIRIHSRFPIGIPERIDDGFCNLLSASRAQIIFVLHINHAKEIDQDIIEAMRQIGLRGVPMLSQTVLLKGVNDTLETLVELMSQLGNIGIIPYYLHQLDRVEGAHHFEVSVETGKRLIEEMKSQLSGYLVPRYVQEIPGKPEKTALL